MQVENYIIILGLAQREEKIDIRYKLLPEAAEAAIVIRDQQQHIVKNFSGLQPTPEGHLSFSIKEMEKGTYTCTTQIGIQEGLSINFTIT